MTNMYGKIQPQHRSKVTGGLAAVWIPVILFVAFVTPAMGITPELWPVIESPVGLDSGIEKRIDGLLLQMSVEQKVGQIIQAEIQFVKPEDVKKYHLGSILNGGGSFPDKNKLSSPGDWVALADAFYHASMVTSDGGVAIPVIWGTDAMHGHSNVYGATLFPHNIGLGATHNPQLIRRIGEITAIEVAVTGIPWTFAPTLAVVRDDRWGRTYESYSEDPVIVRQYAGQMVKGIQGEAGTENFLGSGHMLATAKHFLGDGGTLGGKDQGNTLDSEEEVVNIHAQGYVSALEAGVQTVMVSFSSLNGTKMHGNKELLTGALKNRMGFDGLLVGDWNGHGQVPGCSNKSCAAAINAGIDLIMVPEDWKAFWKNTLKQVKSGEIPMGRMDDAVRRILRVKLRAGLFEKGAPSTWSYAGRKEYMGSAAHREVARQAVRESLVLLKNDQKLLPLKPQSRILVTGPGADDIGMQSGGWTLSWQGTGNRNSDFPGATSIFGGIEETVRAAGGTAVLSEDGSYTDKPDVAIVVWGENPYAEFQGDLKFIQYRPGDTRELKTLQNLKAEGIPVVSVFLSGRPLWVNAHLNASDAFVAAWLPGSEGGGVADVLFRTAAGDVSYDFTGRLSFSWPARADQTDLNVHSENYQPLFAYGFGLSVTDEVVTAKEHSTTGIEIHPDQLADLEIFVNALDERWTMFAFAASDFDQPYENWEISDIDDLQKQKEGFPRVRKADHHAQEDALQMHWEGGYAGGFGVIQDFQDIEAFEENDMSEYALSGGALKFELMFKSGDPGGLRVGMGCSLNSGGCNGVIDLAGLISAEFDTGVWKSFDIELECLQQRGMDFTRMVTAFQIASDRALELVISDIRIAAGTGKAKPEKCTPKNYLE